MKVGGWVSEHYSNDLLQRSRITVNFPISKQTVCQDSNSCGIKSLREVPKAKTVKAAMSINSKAIANSEKKKGD